MTEAANYVHATGSVQLGWFELVAVGTVTLTLSTLVAYLIRRDLFGILEQICGTKVSARFWTSFSIVLIVVGPLFLVSVGSADAASTADFVRRAVYLTSFGIIGAFCVMAAAVMLSPPSQALTRNRTAQVQGSGPDVDPRILR